MLTNMWALIINECIRPEGKSWFVKSTKTAKEALVITCDWALFHSSVCCFYYRNIWWIIVYRIAANWVWDRQIYQGFQWNVQQNQYCTTWQYSICYKKNSECYVISELRRSLNLLKHLSLPNLKLPVLKYLGKCVHKDGHLEGCAIDVLGFNINDSI